MVILLYSLILPDLLISDLISIRFTAYASSGFCSGGNVRFILKCTIYHGDLTLSDRFLAIIIE